MGLPQLRPSLITTRVLCGVEQLEQLAPEWERLWEDSSNPEPFYRPEWAIAYLRAFNPQAQVFVVEARRDGRLCALLPLVENARSIAGFQLRTLSGTANVHGNRFDILSHKGEDTCVQAIWNALCELPFWDALTLPNVPADGVAPQLLQLAVADGFLVGRWPGDHTPFIRLPSGERLPTSFGRTSHFRSNLRRRMRKAKSEGELRLIRLDHFDPSAFREFLRLEKGGWKGRHGTAIASRPDTLAFYEDIACQAARRGYLSMYFLELAGRPIAVHLGLNSRGCYYVPKLAYDESRAELSPGQLLIEHVLTDLQARDVRLFDFVGPQMPWKEEWTKDVRPHWSLYIYRPTSSGRLLYLARFKVRRMARDFIRGRSDKN